MRHFIFITAIFALSVTGLFAQELPPVPDNEVGIIESLPARYPDNYILLNGVGFSQNGRIAVVDIAADNFRYKGAVSAGYTADLQINNEKGEFYILETYYSRGTRGERTDIITIYDQSTLMPKGEIPLEAGKRFLVMPMAGKFEFTNDKKWLLVSNYTPASSVSVVDIESKEILSEIPIPGCNLAYPLGQRGFATMCGYGEMISVNLDENGNAVSEHVSQPFNDLDNDPHFDKTTRVGDVVYIPTFHGMMTPIDLSGENAQVGESWPLVTDEAEIAQGWRPGGWQPITSDGDGNLYLLMHKNGYNGSHKDNGQEVWVFDPKEKKRISRLVLKEEAWSIHVTGEERPHLVTSLEEDIWIYDAASGDYKYMMSLGAFSPYMHNPE